MLHCSNCKTWFNCPNCIIHTDCNNETCDKDLYKIIGIEKTNDFDLIKKAFKKHPKIYPNKLTNEIERRQDEIAEVFNILMDDKYKKIYDKNGYKFVKMIMNIDNFCKRHLISNLNVFKSNEIYYILFINNDNNPFDMIFINNVLYSVAEYDENLDYNNLNWKRKDNIKTEFPDIFNNLSL